MTDLATASEQHGDKIGPGRLVLVVGPSGAGKDTLIGLAQVACAGDDRVVFTRRIVTREASTFENNEQVSDVEFGEARARGDFAIDWRAHGLSYALPKDIDADLRAGRSVVANISRTVIARLRASYRDVVVVLITAPPEVLAARLMARGRNSDGPIAERLNRSVDGAVPDVTIQNVGAPEIHVQSLIDIIKGC
jgi:ribose 1,5-bisphosphokinase